MHPYKRISIDSMCARVSHAHHLHNPFTMKQILFLFNRHLKRISKHSSFAFYRQLMKSSIQDAITLFLAELLGTGMITFAGCMSCVPINSENPPSHLQICLAFGLVIMIIILIFGAVSGAHLNPA